MPELNATPLDLAVLVTYVIGTRIAFGWYLARKAQAGPESYFLAGRAIGWPIIGLSFYVSNMSGSTFVGLPAAGYHDGIAVYHYEWLAAPILVLFVLILPPLLPALEGGHGARVPRAAGAATRNDPSPPPDSHGGHAPGLVPASMATGCRGS